MGELIESNKFKVFLNTSLEAKYKIWLHDPDFFLETQSASSVPVIDVTLDLRGATLGAHQSIGAERHELMDRAGARCRDYRGGRDTFGECVAASVRNKTGCRVRYNQLLFTFHNFSADEVGLL